MLLEEVLRYATMGYPVLPLVPGGKVPLGKLVPRGLKEASRDPEAIREWWRRAPGANLGILPPEGVLVLDVDEPGALDPGMAAPLHRTPSGGFHLFFRLPPGVEVPARVRALPGVDFRGMGRAYVVAPPSWTTEGWYVAERPLVSPEELPLVPGEILEAVTRSQEAPELAPVAFAEVGGKRLVRLLEWAAERVRLARVGTRHDTLLRMARLMGGYLHLGLPEEVALRALVEAALEAGLPLEEAERTARWGLEVGRDSPLELPERRLAWSLEESGKAQDLALRLALGRVNRT